MNQVLMLLLTDRSPEIAFDWAEYIQTVEVDDEPEEVCSHLEDDLQEELEWRFWGPDVSPEDNTEALEELEVLRQYRKDDPCAPHNMTRYHPDHDDSLYMRCVLTGRNSSKKKIHVLVSSWRFEWANAFQWNVNNDKSQGRYPRRHPLKSDKAAGRDKTIYLYRDVMFQMLVEQQSQRERELVRFGLKPCGDASLEAEMLLNVGIVHHKNHDPEDCRDENLELTTAQENRQQANDKPGAGGYVGVHRVSRRGDDGKPRWYYQAEVKALFRPGLQRRQILGTFANPELALLARALWLLAHPKALPSIYTPTVIEAQVWRCAKHMAQGQSLCLMFGQVGALPLNLQKYITFARIQFGKGQTARVNSRC